MSIRSRLEPWLQAIWYGERPPPLMLGLLSQIYALLRAGHRALYQYRLLSVAQLPCPVLVVGNIAVGGGGKTPTVIALCRAMREQGKRVGVVSRGYGRIGHAVRLVGTDHTAQEVGDEPLLIARACQVPVAVGADRVAAVQALLASHALDLVISDDGLQHWRLPRAMELLLIPARGHGNGRLLPAGPLREPSSAAPLSASTKRIVIQSGESHSVSHRLSVAVPLSALHTTQADERPLEAWRDTEVHALAGIADPERFFAALRTFGIKVKGHAFPDHHAFTQDDVARLLDARTVFCTDKDAVKLAPLLAQRAAVEPTTQSTQFWRVPLRTELPESVLAAVRDLLR